MWFRPIFFIRFSVYQTSSAAQRVTVLSTYVCVMYVRTAIPASHSSCCPEIFAIKLIAPIKLEPNRADHA